MNQLINLSKPGEQDLLVAFFDLTGFARLHQQHTSQEIFSKLSGYYEFVGEIVESAGGLVVKFIGDAGLIVFPTPKVDEGVLALLKLKLEGDKWCQKNKLNSRNIIKAHYGSVYCGKVGTKSDKRFDVFGQTVNTAALINSNGVALSQQLFRKLQSETRKHFKKHTPPITYIPLKQSHRD